MPYEEFHSSCDSPFVVCDLSMHLKMRHVAVCTSVKDEFAVFF